MTRFVIRRALRVSAREQKLLLVAVILLALGVLWGVGRPLWSRLRQLTQRTSASSQQLERFRELAARTSVIERKAQAYAPLVSTEPEELLQRQFLDELEQWARVENLQINLAPRPIQREGSVSRLGVELDVDASQDVLLAFLDRVLNAPSLIELSRLQISAGTSHDSSLKASLLVDKVIVRQ